MPRDKPLPSVFELLNKVQTEPLVSERPVAQSLQPFSDPYLSLPPGGFAMSTKPPSERPPRMLIVEPDPARREILERLVNSDGYEAIFLPDGDEVLRLTREWEPDLILLTQEWSGGNGYEVCGELRAADRRGHTPIIMLSSSADELAVARGLLAGADDFVQDVSRQVELRARIRVQLRHKRHYDALKRVRNERDNLKRDARIDPLTGVLNRRTLERAVEDRVSTGERFGVLFIDLDHFKAVNDDFGHDVGDSVLKKTAHALKQGIRPGDILGRYGGEEFVALVAGAGPESARLVAERLRKAVQSVSFPEGGPARVTISVGATVFDPRAKEEEAGELLKRADKALYSAKSAGRNCVVSVAYDGEERVAPAVLSRRVAPPPPKSPEGLIEIIEADTLGKR